MIRPLLISIVSWLVFALPAIGADIDAASINHAEFDASKPPSEGRIDAVVVKVQVLLDRARFSPGEIDGKLGENAQKALKAFGEAKGLRVNDALTPEVWKALVATSSDAAVGEYRVSKDDLKGPFLQKLPAKMEEMKKSSVSRLHEPSRGHRREVSHERRAVGGLESGKEIRPSR